MLAYQKGDYSAFEKLFNRYSPRVYGYLRKRVMEPELVEEIFQNIFLKFHESRLRYDSRLPLAPWLFTIARNTLIDATRTKSHLGNRLVPLDENLHSKATSETVPKPLSLEGVDPYQNPVLRLRYKEALSFEEIAVRLDTTPQVIRKRVSRALAGLRRNLTGSKIKKSGP